MSGDSAVVFIASGEQAFAATAIATLGALPDDLPPWALVGGVSVAVNLASFHRPTGDLDTVSLDGEQAVTLLLGDGGHRSRNGVRLRANETEINLDIIDVSDGDPDEGAYLAHRLALETAEPRHLCVVDLESRPLSDAWVPVAAPEAIVAMKLHALEGRRTSRPEKRSGDLSDIIRLTEQLGAADIARRLTSCSSANLLRSTAELCRKYFVDEADRSYRWLRIDSRSSVSEIQRDDLFCGEELAAELSRPA
ncbi:MAG: nucleotidyl transferase AbiEii/AbiGii toxin family protein [bacterium]|nr:nucleotidyl transferase AbiEii/AbiGii toxin family protein [bacterium]